MAAPASDTPSSARLDEFDAFLIDLNRAASRVILPLFRADHGLTDKGGPGGFDPVTNADRGAERAIRALIAERYPDHGVIGEEYGEDRPDAEFVWVLDPVDGTRAFIAGLPLWCVLIGLRYQGRPLLGSIGQPFLGELYIGHAGAARLMIRGESRPLRVRACSDVARRLSPPPTRRAVLRRRSSPPGAAYAAPPDSHGWAATLTPTPWWPPARSIWSSRRA